MSVIVPAILADSADLYKAQIEKVHEFAQRLHIDISDGEFAPTFTISTAEIWWPAGVEADIHAMVARPDEHVDALLALKPSMIIFHAETAGDLVATMTKIKQQGVKAGVALLRSTVPETVAPIIEAADHVLLFTGELGKFGGTASLMQLEKVRLVRAINGSAEIGWDGGVTLDNAYTLTQGGVQALTVGGTLQRSDNAAATYEALVKEINKHGIL